MCGYLCRKRSVLIGVIVFMAAVGVAFLAVEPVHADPPPPDVPCRGCHGTMERDFVFPSGETMPLRVPLETLAASPHTLLSEPPVSCSGCHIDATRYRFPHVAPPAQTRSDYRTLASATCTKCHYPHNPYHEGATRSEAPEMAGAPTCVDCHGSHDVAPVGLIAASMPGACVECHEDRTTQWAADLLAPRPGLGAGAPGYAGSERCLGCHADLYRTWRNTLHARMIQDPAADPSVVVGDFSAQDPDLTFTLTDVVYTIGSRWKQRYITRTVAGALYILPAQWNLETGEWVAYHPDDWQEREWRQSCGSCHVTGLETETWTFTEFGIGCESCHGPAEEHIADPERVGAFAAVDDQVCGACHSRGVSPDGYAFPATFRPGDSLADHFTFTADAEAVWPDGSAHQHHQQYMDWSLGSEMQRASETSCLTCHTVHDNGGAPSQLRAPVNQLCVDCHEDKAALVNHTPYHEQALTQRSFLCVDCHMPRMATSAVAYDIHNHSLLQPNPEASLEYGGVEAMPNACNLCHISRDEDADWAMQTIAHARELGIVGQTNFFEPGAMPTSPPPPTPIPSVGQPAEPYRVQTGRGLRNTALAVMGLFLLGVAYVIVRSLTSRRVRNA